PLRTLRRALPGPLGVGGGAELRGPARGALPPLPLRAHLPEARAHHLRRRDAPRGRSGGLPPLPHRGGLHPLGPPTGRAALRLADRNLRVPRRRSRHRPALRERRSAQGGGGGALAVRARRRVGGASGAFPGAARATPPLRGTSMRVALFGGAFDPPHVGHLLVTAY